MVFRNRRDAGRRLALRLLRNRQSAPVVLALPRGGVVVGSEGAGARRAPLGVVLSRRLTAPDHPEIAVGAIGEGGVRIIDALAMRLLGVSPEQLSRIETIERGELQRRLEIYRDGRPLSDLAGRHVILVDDGLASGLTARAALEVVRRHR